MIDGRIVFYGQRQSFTRRKQCCDGEVIDDVWNALGQYLGNGKRIAVVRLPSDPPYTNR
jgi:hypothetical protein